jgi:hypothetical protein
MIRVSYERYEADNNKRPAKWTVVRKDFPNMEEADRFIFRIANNVIVGNIWKSSI